MINYIIESSICLACFYTFYWLFLSQEKLLSINRFYLLTSAILSLCIPLLNFDFHIGIFSPLEIFNSKSIVGATNSIPSLETSSPFISLGAVYVIGVLIAIGLLTIKLVVLKKRLGKGLSFKSKQVEIAETDGLNAYSFFNTIFIGKDLSENTVLKEHIIAHELAHIEGKHSLDLLFFELLQCIYWFNPFSYFYTKSAKLQHEYIADERALEITNPKHYERSLLELTLSKVSSSLISNFSEHPIQKRLKMIQKLNSNIMKKLKLAFVLPVLALLVIAFACTEEIEPTDVPLDEKSEIEVPLNVDLNGVAEGVNIYKYKLKGDGLENEVTGEYIEAEVLEKSYLRLVESVKEVEGTAWTETETPLTVTNTFQVEGVREERIVEGKKALLQSTLKRVQDNSKLKEKPVVVGVKAIKRH